VDRKDGALAPRAGYVAVPGTGTSGPASFYPAPRTVAGQEGLITDLNVAIDGIWHQNPDDLTCSWSDHRARR
jgi:hypothetical protein